MSKYTAKLRIDEQPTFVDTSSFGEAQTSDDSDAIVSTQLFQYEPAGNADAVLLFGNTEAAYETAVWLDSSGVSFNAKYDELVLETTAAKADILYTIQNELSRMPSIRTVVMQAQYFTTFNISTGVPSTTCRPATSYNFRTRLVSSSEWAVDTYTPATALQWPLSPAIFSATPNDASFVKCARYLAQRGYKIGVSPVVRFIDTTGSNQANWEQWRGSINPSTISTGSFNTWLGEYETFILHYMNLLLNGGIIPSLFYLGSEFRDIAAKATSAQYAAWIAKLQSLADQLKALSSTTTIVYGAYHEEYAYVNNSGLIHQGLFPMDALWSYPGLDVIGVDWFEPLFDFHANDPNILRKGVMSGENFDTDQGGYDANEQRISSSDGQGTTTSPASAKLTIDNAIASKALALFLSSAHYVTKPGGVNAGASPLAGDYFGSATILGDMSGPAVTSKVSGISSTYDGMRPPPKQRDCWLALNGTSDYGSITFPTYSTAPTSYTVEIDLRYSGGSSTASRVLKGDVLDVYVDSTGSPLLKFVMSRSGGTNTSAGIAVTSGNDYLVSLLVESNQYTISVNGTPVEVAALGGAATMPGSAGTWYFGRNSAASDYLSGRLYYVRLQGDKSGIKSYGGIYYFEESYAGVRTSWIPNSKSAMITAVGFASQQFSCVRPDALTQVLHAGTGTASLPDTYELKDYWTSLASQGLTVNDIVIPYGGTGLEDQYHQAVCFAVAIAALRSQGATSCVAFYLDARPPETLTALVDNETLYYTFGPEQLLNHNIGGKKAGGHS
jgi:hypothetical protein